MWHSWNSSQLWGERKKSSKGCKLALRRKERERTRERKTIALYLWGCMSFLRNSLSGRLRSSSPFCLPLSWGKARLWRSWREVLDPFPVDMWRRVLIIASWLKAGAPQHILSGCSVSGFDLADIESVSPLSSMLKSQIIQYNMPLLPLSLPLYFCLLLWLVLFRDTKVVFLSAFYYCVHLKCTLLHPLLSHWV